MSRPTKAMWLGTLFVGALVACGDDLTINPVDERNGVDVDTYYDIRDASRWAAFDIATVDGGAVGYCGGAFDGRYLYLAPYYNRARFATQAFHGLVARYDTNSSFISATSWSTFDATAIHFSARGYCGAAFDGRYVYFAPTGNLTDPALSVLRYDTVGRYDDRRSWDTFDVRHLGDVGRGFAGAVFDGRYVYLVPKASVTNAYVRYDTRQDFSSSMSWDVSDPSSAIGRLGSYGGVFDGRYLYFAPWGSWGRNFARYDSLLPFGAKASWEAIDFRAVLGPDESFVDYVGVGFDGRNVFFVPNYADRHGNDSGNDGRVVKFTVGGEFSDPGRWHVFDAKRVSSRGAGFCGAAFDGRHVYFIPGLIDDAVLSANADLIRYDREAAFDDPSAWDAFDVRVISGVPREALGGIFDGQNVYLVPYADGRVLRFQARAVRHMPTLPSFFGSFF